MDRRSMTWGNFAKTEHVALVIFQSYLQDQDK